VVTERARLGQHPANRLDAGGEVGAGEQVQQDVLALAAQAVVRDAGPTERLVPGDLARGRPVSPTRMVKLVRLAAALPSSRPPATPRPDRQAGISCRGWSAWSARGWISSGPLEAPRPVLLTAVDTARTCSGSFSIPLISLWAAFLSVRSG
jgi:hypothetical protein